MRRILNINEGWRFLKAAVPVETAVAYAERGEAVTLPHTWNALDGQDGGNDYHRGLCWYVREVTAEELSGAVNFLEINGANHTAEVYLDGQLLARHEGGYATFRVALPHPGTLAVSVDNGDSHRVYPQKADFTFYGGLYRDVNIVSVPKEHFELLKTARRASRSPPWWTSIRSRPSSPWRPGTTPSP